MTYSVERTDYGMRAELGDLDMSEVDEFLEAVQGTIGGIEGSFNVVADQRGLQALPDEGQQMLVEAMRVADEQGLDRSAVVVDSSLASLQQQRLRDEADVDGQKIIDADDVDDWEQTALDWVTE